MNKMKMAAKACMVAGSTALVSVNSFALDAAANTAIDNAVTSGSGSVTAVVVGVITLAALVTGAGLIVSWLKR